MLRVQMSFMILDFKFVCPSQEPYPTHREINNHLYNSTVSLTVMFKCCFICFQAKNLNNLLLLPTQQ